MNTPSAEASVLGLLCDLRITAAAPLRPPRILQVFCGSGGLGGVPVYALLPPGLSHPLHNQHGAKDVREILGERRQTFRESAPGAEEAVSYRMPLSWTATCRPAAFRSHICFCPAPPQPASSGRSSRPAGTERAASASSGRSRSLPADAEDRAPGKGEHASARGRPEHAKHPDPDRRRAAVPNAKNAVGKQAAPDPYKPPAWKNGYDSCMPGP